MFSTLRLSAYHAFSFYKLPNIMAVASGGASGARPPHLNSVPSYFMFGPPNYHEGVELLCAVVDSQSAIAY